MAMKLLLQAANLASAGRLTAVIPYFGYGRQDRKDQPRTPITAKLVAREIEAAMGVSQPRHVVLVHPHFSQLQGFFDIPSDVLFPTEEFVGVISKLDTGGKPLVFVAADIGGVKQADVFAKRLKTPMAIVHKRRDPTTGELGEATVIGDVRGYACIVVDDMFDTCGTLRHAAVALCEAGAASVYACATHGIFSGPAVERIAAAPVQQIIVTDTLPQVDGGFSGRVRTIGCGKLIATAIWCDNTDNSLSSLTV
jgi:ribose-phosphate pyrophosphokinase